eukprot:TRINITY_DN76128_c0_g1_i1.p1 TRINITY_DN76128_c0_g1~~TRINITY_DN76128_c0_g1_i1.p1  ORF type:complete len:134 (-),score=12.47 TRINITY_DN76128_c0_g1_i1:504-905(-)
MAQTRLLAAPIIRQEDVRQRSEALRRHGTLLAGQLPLETCSSVTSPLATARGHFSNDRADDSGICSSSRPPSRDGCRMTARCMTPRGSGVTALPQNCRQSAQLEPCATLDAGDSLDVLLKQQDVNPWKACGCR